MRSYLAIIGENIDIFATFWENLMRQLTVNSHALYLLLWNPTQD